MKKKHNMRAEIISRRIHREFQYEFTTMMFLDITFLQVSLMRAFPAQAVINRYYRTRAEEFYSYAQKILYKDAVQEYIKSQSNDFPFRPYGAAMDYALTFNGRCHMSTYFDRYQYTGGAHGNTVRDSATFELNTGRRVTMGSLFPPGSDYRRTVLEQAIAIADANNAKEPGLYFDDYRSLMVKYFNAESFNLTETGISVYYQQYEIAPYAVGIVTFNIPYAKLGIEPVSCG